MRDLTAKRYQEMVVQRYVNNPYLINNTKFDLRLYVIITGINEGNMQAFLCDEAIVRFCTDEYEKATPSNFKNLYQHLTNYSINKGSKNFIEDVTVSDILKTNNATKRTLTALYNEILEKTNDPKIVQTIKTNIHNLCETTMVSLINFI